MQNVHAADYLAAARLLLKRHDACGVEKILNMFDNRRRNEISVVSKKELSFLYKRNGRWQEAAQIWQELVTAMPADYATISELAKWLEHHARDYLQAKILVQKALNQCDTLSEKETKSLLHRLRRLNDKLKTAR
jgi:hypothetical protein